MMQKQMQKRRWQDQVSTRRQEQGGRYSADGRNFALSRARTLTLARALTLSLSLSRSLSVSGRVCGAPRNTQQRKEKGREQPFENETRLRAFVPTEGAVAREVLYAHPKFYRATSACVVRGLCNEAAVDLRNLSVAKAELGVSVAVSRRHAEYFKSRRSCSAPRCGANGRQRQGGVNTHLLCLAPC